MALIGNKTNELKMKIFTLKNLILKRWVGGLLIVAACGHAAADSVRVYDQIGVHGPAITLGEIVELEGQYAQTLGDLVVGRFEKGQERLDIQIVTIRRVMTEAQVNWSDLSLKGKSVCRVSRIHSREAVAVKIDNDRAVTSNNELAVDHALAGQTVSDLILVELVKLNGGVAAESLVVTYRGNADGAAWLNRSIAVGRYELESLSRTGLGQVPVRVRRYDPSGTVEQVTLTAEVARRTQAVVALRQVRRGEVFSRENVGVEEVLLTADHGPTLGSVELMLGQSAAASLRAGTVLSANHVAPDVMIKRGELVTVECVSGALVVSTVGRASEDGVLGDIVAIRNPETRKTFYATVSGRRRATITVESFPAQTLASGREAH